MVNRTEWETEPYENPNFSSQLSSDFNIDELFMRGAPNVVEWCHRECSTLSKQNPQVIHGSFTQCKCILYSSLVSLLYLLPNTPSKPKTPLAPFSSRVRDTCPGAPPPQPTYLNRSKFPIYGRRSKWRLLDTQTFVDTAPIIIGLTTRFGVELRSHEYPALSWAFTKGVLQSIWSASHQTVPFFSPFIHVGHSRRLHANHTKGHFNPLRLLCLSLFPLSKRNTPYCLTRESFTLPPLLCGFRFCERVSLSISIRSNFSFIVQRAE
ncbi:hypothetical protein AVEN_177558-1 [Araneus ventricosus]|uniref:Uncharacterized protein n=1 Tax=Araneus ventricosus TaxID=182803 RepID=A0A4Y2QS08_ARAVE|nr:hypothetical protein AVEN_177558-1 [Araneus ventricosus]